MASKRTRKYATVEGDIVEEGDARARFLVAGINDGVDQDLVERIKDAYQNSPERAEAEARKAADKSEDKAAARAENK
jgi:hypothetical protein